MSRDVAGIPNCGVNKRRWLRVTIREPFTGEVRAVEHHYWGFSTWTKLRRSIVVADVRSRFGKRVQVETEIAFTPVVREWP